MKGTAAFRGQPLLVLVAVLLGWAGLRAAWWHEPPGLSDRWAPTLAAPSLPRGVEPSELVAASPPALHFPRASPAAWVMTRLAPSTMSAPVSNAVSRIAEGSASTETLFGGHPGANPTRAAIGHSLLLAAGLSGLDLPPALAAYLGAAPAPGIPAAAPPASLLPPRGIRASGSRLSADAWLMARDETTTALSGRPTYGRSQAGTVVRYRLAPSNALDPQAYARASSALDGPLERDLVAGLSARLAKRVPLRVAVEARISRTRAGTEVRPAVIAVTEFAPLELPGGLRGEAYVQAGYVGGAYATAFLDGQGRVERPLGRLGDAELSAGAGAWGGAQEGAARLDVGPTAAVVFRFGEGRGRLAADYRFRVAGDAEPRSGPALTVSAGF